MLRIQLQRALDIDDDNDEAAEHIERFELELREEYDRWFGNRITGLLNRAHAAERERDLFFDKYRHFKGMYESKEQEAKNRRKERDFIIGLKREVEKERDEALAENARLREALELLADDAMYSTADGTPVRVRDIARAALTTTTKEPIA